MRRRNPGRCSSSIRDLRPAQEPWAYRREIIVANTPRVVSGLPDRRKWHPSAACSGTIDGLPTWSVSGTPTGQGIRMVGADATVLRGAPAVQFLDSFVGETVKLLPDRICTLSFPTENFRASNGEIGDNPCIATGHRPVPAGGTRFARWRWRRRELLVERGAPEARYETTAGSHPPRGCATPGGDRDILAPVSGAELAYDFPAWLASESPGDRPQRLRLHCPTTHEFRLEPGCEGNWKAPRLEQRQGTTEPVIADQRRLAGANARR